MIEMENKYLIKFYEEKTKIKINLKNGKFYTGTIKELGEHTLIFIDKFNNELPFDLDVISYIDIINKGFQNGN